MNRGFVVLFASTELARATRAAVVKQIILCCIESTRLIVCPLVFVGGMGERGSRAKTACFKAQNTNKEVRNQMIQEHDLVRLLSEVTTVSGSILIPVPRPKDDERARAAGSSGLRSAWRCPFTGLPEVLHCLYKNI